MDTQVIILVADRDDPKHGEITVLGNTTEAERLVETLLEAGFGQEHIRVFGGSEIQPRVSQRPVVTLSPEDIHGLPVADSLPANEEDEGEQAVPVAGAGADERAAEGVASSPFRSLGSPPVSQLAG